MSFIILIILFFIFRYSFIRFKRNPSGSLLNPLFYLVIFSSLYLLLPLVYIDFVFAVTSWDVEQSIVNQAYFWSIWYVLVFTIFYKLSIDHQYKYSSILPSRLAVNCSFFIWISLSILLVFIILVYCPTIYAVKSDRGLAIQIYDSTINARFKLRILLYIHLATMFILFWKSPDFLYLFPCIFYAIIDYSHGGRTVTVMVLSFVYLLIILKTNKTYIRSALIIVFFLITVGLLQRSSSSDFLWNLYMAGAEFSNTYLTTIYVLQHPDYMHNGFDYMIVSISKLFPGGVVDKMMGFGEWYGEVLSDKINMGYGLAGNLITEALIYGGKLFAFFNPIFIGLVLVSLNRMRGNKQLFQILLLIFLSISMQNMVRSYFWGFVLYPFQILLFFLFWLKNDYSKKVFL